MGSRIFCAHSPEDFSRRRGAQIPLRVNRVGHYILSVVDFRRDPSRIAPECPEASASFLHFVHERPDVSDGGLHLLNTPDGLYRCETPPTFATCKAVTLGNVGGGSLTDPEKIAMKLHVNWGHASAQQLKRALVDSAENSMHLFTCVDAAVARCEVCQAFEEAPHAPAAGTPNAAVLNEKLQGGLLLLEDIITLRVLDVFS